MKEFIILAKDEKRVVIKKGFSFPALFFTWIWAYCADIWRVAILFMILSLFLALIKGQRTEYFCDFISVVIHFLFGFKGNEWAAMHWKRKGFIEICVIDAKNKKEATEKSLLT